MSDKHEKIDKAIKDSIRTRTEPATVGQIAKQTGEHKSLVARRYHILGFEFIEGRWVWRGSKRTKENE